VSAPADLAIVGDVHLEPDDPRLPEFLACVDRAAAETRRIVFVGDLFDVWVGRPEFEGPHHERVVAHFARLRSRGARLLYVEGNRDYGIASSVARAAFDVVAPAGITEQAGGHRIRIEHGDLANAADRRYRTWRRVSRSRPLWAAMRLLPPGARRGLATSVERRLRGTNRAFKGTFPEVAVRSYARPFFAGGHDVLVLGHFHESRDFRSDGGRIVVLPLWKHDPRWLRVGRDGSLELVP
jgi:UDP-2,3-diacylglucosamine hydrolase